MSETPDDAALTRREFRQAKRDAVRAGADADTHELLVAAKEAAAELAAEDAEAHAEPVSEKPLPATPPLTKPVTGGRPAAGGASAAGGALAAGETPPLTKPPAPPGPIKKPMRPAAGVNGPLNPVRVAPMRRGYGGSALVFAISALAGACFVGWFFPVALLAIVLGIVAIRKRTESTQLGWWAIGLSILALAYSALWISWVGAELHWW